MNPVRTIITILLIVISIEGIALYDPNNHGHFMFRLHMTEDWIIWGIVLVSGVT